MEPRRMPLYVFFMYANFDQGLCPKGVLHAYTHNLYMHACMNS
jgi:hypothetical protein